MNSNFLRQSKISDPSLNNPNLKGTHLYGDYVGRRQIIEQQRVKKENLLKELENGRNSFHGKIADNQFETRGNALGITV